MAKRGRDDLERLERDSERSPLDPGVARRMAAALEAAGRSDEALAWLTWWEALLDREWRVLVRESGREPEVHVQKPEYLRAARAAVSEAERAFESDQRRLLSSPWELVLGLQRSSGAGPVVRESLPLEGLSSTRATPSGFVAGDLIELVRMIDDPDPIPPGSRGRVTGVVRSVGVGVGVGEGWQVWVRWQDLRRSLSLEVPPDVADVIEPLATAAAGSFKGRTTLVQVGLKDFQGHPDIVVVHVTMFHGQPRAFAGRGSLEALRKKFAFSGAHAALRDAAQVVLGARGMTALGVDFTAPPAASGVMRPARLGAFEGDGERAFVAPGAFGREVPLVSARYLLTLAWLFGRLLRPMPAAMLEDSAPWSPEPEAA